MSCSKELSRQLHEIWRGTPEIPVGRYIFKVDRTAALKSESFPPHFPARYERSQIWDGNAPVILCSSHLVTFKHFKQNVSGILETYSIRLIESRQLRCCCLFYEPFSMSNYVASTFGVLSDWWIVKSWEGIGLGLMEAVPVLACRDRGSHE